MVCCFFFPLKYRHKGKLKSCQRALVSSQERWHLEFGSLQTWDEHTHIQAQHFQVVCVHCCFCVGEPKHLLCCKHNWCPQKEYFYYHSRKKIIIGIDTDITGKFSGKPSNMLKTLNQN